MLVQREFDSVPPDLQGEPMGCLAVDLVAALLGFLKQGTEEALLASFERRERLGPELAAPKQAIALGSGEVALVPIDPGGDALGKGVCFTRLPAESFAQ
jgi:hypothetical protein